jgi:hypothetical protein
MTSTTYRIGGAPPPTTCARHAGVLVAFQCQECLDSLCETCRGPGRQRRCLVCHEALERQHSISPEVAVRPRDARWRVAIVVLTIVNVLLGATWLGAFWLQPAVPTVDRALMEVELVAGVVERSRNAEGLVPAELASLLEGLPAPVAERVKSGAIRYRPSRDRRTFGLTATLGERR